MDTPFIIVKSKTNVTKDTEVNCDIFVEDSSVPLTFYMDTTKKLPASIFNAIHLDLSFVNNSIHIDDEQYSLFLDMLGVSTESDVEEEEEPPVVTTRRGRKVKQQNFEKNYF